MKEFFVLHTEKIVLAVCGVLMAYFLYSAFSQKGYDKTPEMFSNTIRTATQNVASTKPNLENLKIPDFQTKLEEVRQPLKPDAYRLSTIPNRPLELGHEFRDRPQILASQPPETLSNRGLIVTIDKDAKSIGDAKKFRGLLEKPYPAELIWFLGNEDMREALAIIEKEDKRKSSRAAGGSGRRNEGSTADNETGTNESAAKKGEGRYWVEIVAPFPHADQIREFVKALKEGAREVGLRYALAEVERRELGENLQWTAWARVPWQKQFELFEKAAVLDKPFEEFPDVAVLGLVMQVPERAKVGTDENADRIQVHDPLFLESFKNPEEAEYSAEELNPRADEEALAQQRRAQKDARDARKAADEDDVEDEARKSRSGKTSGGAFENASEVNVAMMRIFDFTVEPGRRYQYRVRAVVYNPNFNRADVVDVDLASDPFLFGPWSEASTEVFVEPDVEWFMADTRSTRPNQMTTLVTRWWPSMGRWVPVEFNHQSGQVIGVSSSRKVQVATFNAQDNKLQIIEEETGSLFDTNTVVLDISPGVASGKIGDVDSGRISPPREAIIVNEYGDLIRRSELVDRSNSDLAGRQEEYARAKELATGEKPGDAPRNGDDVDRDNRDKPKEDLVNPLGGDEERN